MLTQDEVLHLVTSVVSDLTCAELRLWLNTIHHRRDPRNLPHYSDYQELFSEPGRWPTVHLITQITFNDLARIKLDMEC